MNNTTEITQRVNFTCSYIYKGRLYSSFYRFEVTVVPLNDSASISFEEFTKLLKEAVPNNKFISNSKNVNQIDFEIRNILWGHNVSVYMTNYEFSTEKFINQLSLSIVDSFKYKFPEFEVKESKLQENLGSYVKWYNNVKE